LQYTHGRPVSRILFPDLRRFDDHSSKRRITPAPLAANPNLRAKVALRRYRPEGDRTRARFLFGIAPGGACLAGPVARPAVRSYRTVSP